MIVSSYAIIMPRYNAKAAILKRVPMSVLLVAAVACALLRSAGAAADDSPKPLTPVEARKKVGEDVLVELTVKAAKDRLEKRGEIYLDSELDFRDEKNFAAVI